MLKKIHLDEENITPSTSKCIQLKLALRTQCQLNTCLKLIVQLFPPEYVYLLVESSRGMFERCMFQTRKYCVTMA
jgi:hypothetical protein